MDIQIIAAIVFVLFLIIFLLLNKKNIVLQKIFHPLLYMILYKSSWGIKFINKTAEKYNEWIKFFGYCCIGLGFFGMAYVLVNILLLSFVMFKSVQPVQGVSLVLPFTHIPGIGYLSFLHWIVAIFILAIVHEFSHGIVARAHGLEIKSSGFAFLCLFVPLIPAAFVEPDEKKLQKHSDVVKYSIFAAGPMMNIVVALLLLLAFPYVADSSKLAPFENQITEPVGFSFDITNTSLPAAKAGLTNGMIIDSLNGKNITDANDFAEQFYCVKPGDTVIVGINNTNYSVKTTATSDGKALLGINNLKNERVVLPKYDVIKDIYYWFKELFMWLFTFNLLIGLFNLLPLGITDGGLMMNTMLHHVIKDKARARKILAFISFLLLLILLLGLFTTYFGNPFRIFLK